MYCSNCGTKIDYESNFCINCGAPLNNVNSPQPTAPSPLAPEVLGMGWYKFLIYFSMFAGAILNLYNAYQLISGEIYQLQADYVYRIFDGLKEFDVVIGILFIGLAALGIYTRFRLANFRKNGPLMITVSYIVLITLQLIYVIGLTIIIPSEQFDSTVYGSTLINIVTSIVMIIINAVYFKKRKHLFVN